MRSIILGAPAKINLSLDIIGTLPDGFHEVEMIMQSVSLMDVIKLTRIPEGIRLHTSCDKIPAGEENLAWKAASFFIEELGIKDGVEIYIDKQIPVAAGLAGGSTDAAAVLRGMNYISGATMSENHIYKLAAELGSDVPFCLKGGTALARGRGEKVTFLPDISRQNIVLVVPPVEVSTAEIYDKYDQIQPDIFISTEKMVKAIQEGKSISWSEGWRNVLEEVTGRLVEDIARIKDKLSYFEPVFSMMSGSGPAVFSVVNSCEKAEYIQKKWPYAKDRVFVTSFKGRY
ncbi:MAG: 4-(cytidine 5'-diphospho)-2-C-methyl-D-erythritol kinase [Halanaerobiales bacterium]